MVYIIDSIKYKIWSAREQYGRKFWQIVDRGSIQRSGDPIRGWVICTRSSQTRNCINRYRFATDGKYIKSYISLGNKSIGKSDSPRCS